MCAEVLPRIANSRNLNSTTALLFNKFQAKRTQMRCRCPEGARPAIFRNRNDFSNTCFRQHSPLFNAQIHYRTDRIPTNLYVQLCNFSCRVRRPFCKSQLILSFPAIDPDCPKSSLCSLIAIQRCASRNPCNFEVFACPLSFCALCRDISVTLYVLLIAKLVTISTSTASHGFVLFALVAIKQVAI